MERLIFPSIASESLARIAPGCTFSLAKVVWFWNLVPHLRKVNRFATIFHAASDGSTILSTSCRAATSDDEPVFVR